MILKPEKEKTLLSACLCDLHFLRACCQGRGWTLTGRVCMCGVFLWLCLVVACSDFGIGTLCLSSAVLRNIRISVSMWSLQMICSSGITLTLTVYHSGIWGAVQATIHTLKLTFVRPHISYMLKRAIVWVCMCRKWMLVSGDFMLVYDEMWRHVRSKTMCGTG